MTEESVEMPERKQKLSRREVLTKFRTEEILDAAIEQIGREGMERVTMDRVARRAGVAKGTVYLYFKDKSELKTAVLERLFSLLLERVEEAATAQGALRKRLQLVAEEFYTFASEYSEVFRHVHSPGGLVRRAREKHGKDCRNELLALVSGIFSRAVESGEVKESDPELLGLLFLKSIHAVLVRDVYKRDRDVRKDARFLIDLFCNGISERENKKYD